jgi:hypothetical protein
VDDALVQLFARQSFAQRLGHETNEIEEPLPILRQPLILLHDPILIPTTPRQA